MEEISVAELYIFPIKSCKGIRVSSVALCKTGFRWDRHWMIVNEKGRMLSQRVLPRLALVEPVIPREFLVKPLNSLPPNASLGLKAPEMETLQVPLFEGKSHKEKVDVSVWDWNGVALNEGTAASEWFSKFLGKTCYLVRHHEGVTTRLTDGKYAKDYQTSFSDQFPFLVASEASMDLLNSKLASEKLLINRFRPNIVAKGCTAFAEDLWKDFKVGSLDFQGVKLCSRCKMPTIDQETGEVGVEPTLTLQTFRRGDLLCNEKSAEKQVFFGQNAVCKSFKHDAHDACVVSEGDPIQVMSKFVEACV